MENFNHPSSPRGTPSITDSLKSQKQKEKEIKKSYYVEITTRFPAFRNVKVMETYSELGSLDLGKKGEGRKFIKHNKVNVDNTVYIGEVSKSYKRDGLGFLVHEDGSYYEGYFEEGHYNGMGRLITTDGDIYEGNWEGHLLQGNGKICIKHPFSLYTGFIKDGIPEGDGLLAATDKSEYSGEFKEGKKHGKGVLKFIDGSRYEGEFLKDKQSGDGIFYFKDGSVLTGTWLRNKIVGDATKKWPDGKVYVGQFVDGFINGKGKMVWPDGKTYEGFWNNERPHGIGKECKPNGIILEGQWRAGKIFEILKEVTISQTNLFSGRICDTVKELEDKVNEMRKRREKPYDEVKYKAILNIHHAIDHCHTIENKLEKERRIKVRVEEKLLNNAKKRSELMKIPRAIDKKEDCKQVGMILNKVKLQDSMRECEKIWNRRKEAGNFDYFDPDVLVPEDIEMHEEWVDLGNSNYYIGETNKKSQFNGRGIFIKKREVYEGYFLSGLRHGIGREITIHTSYIGYWYQGKKSGFGTKIKNNSLYVGDFEEDMYSGVGFLRTPEASYNGAWKSGKQHGKGVLKFADGRVYKGDFEDGIIKGYGSIIWPNGKSVIGYWENGEIIGESQKLFLSQRDMPSALEDEDHVSDVSHDERSSRDLLEDLRNRIEPSQSTN